MSAHSPTQPAAEFREARRAMTSVLASAERRCLIWLAGRLPPWVTSDQLTALALAAMLTAGLSFWAAQFSRYWLVGVVVSLGLNWFGDSLDGTLARVRRQERPRYGFYIDHVVDCVGALLLLAGMASSGFMSPFIAMALLVAYLMLSIEIYLATYCLAVFKLSFWGLGPTELRLLLALGTLTLARDPTVDVFGRSFRLFDFGGAIAIAIIGATFVLSVARNARALQRAERPPQGAPQGRRDRRPDRRAPRRWLIFNCIGAIGVVLQLAGVWTLTAVAGINYLIATALAVEVTIVHNFVWHVMWTWSDRRPHGGDLLRSFLRFNATSGVVSIAGNLAITAVLVERAGLHHVVANGAAIALCSTANFLLVNSKVFAPALGALVLAVAATASVEAADLSPETAAAFDRYARATERRLDEQRDGRRPFLRLDGLSAAQQAATRARLQHRDVVVFRPPPDSAVAFPGAMCHHWVGTTLLAGVRLDDVVALMQRYDDYQRIYQPAVRRSRLVARTGNRFRVSLQLFMKKVVTVVLNTESTAVYVPAGRTRVQVRSQSTRIAEIRNPGDAVEQEEPVDRGSGFLWRFNNYCAVDQRVEGTYVECESVSLTRDVPVGLGWLIGPFVSSIPRESLEFTLRSLRAAVRPLPG